MRRSRIWTWLLAALLCGSGACSKSEPVNKAETLPTNRLPGKRLPP
jgi:hypothetical protein